MPCLLPWRTEYTDGVAAHVLFIHDRPDWLLLAILTECRRLGIEATVIGHRGYRGFGGCREARTPEQLLRACPDARERLERFRRCHRHISVNAEKYERFCFERWFLIHAYVELSGRAPIYLDSDCLPLPGFDIDTLPEGPMLDAPFLNPIRSRESLRAFLDFMTAVHENGEVVTLAERYAVDGIPHVSDMFLLKEYAIRFPERCRLVAENLLAMGLCPNLHFHDGFTGSHGVRQVFRDVLDGTVHCRRTDGTLQRFYTLHFQGDSKRLAPRFLHRSTMRVAFGRATLKSLYRDRYGSDPASAGSPPLH